MIGRLEGTLLRDGEHVIVDCGGIGYEVTCSAFTLAALPAHGERVALRVYTKVSDTAITLYGFLEAQERGLFDLLITVKNVGPSTAITILSGATPRDIATLIARQDVPGLTRIKGIGKKTAELLVVELHERCEMLVLTWNAGSDIRSAALPAGAPRAKPGPSFSHPMLGDVLAALITMGWKPAAAEQAVSDLAVGDDATIESLLRQALRAMPR